MAKRLTQEEFLKQAKETNPQFDYSETVFKNTRTKVKVKCEKGHEFETLPKPLQKTNGRTCPICNKRSQTSSYSDEPTELYFLQIRTDDPEFKYVYKVGITKETVQERFTAEDMTRIKILRQFKFQTGKPAHDFEKEIHKALSEYKYGRSKPLSYGNTELFSENPVELLGLG